nr:hypothetical protein [Actinomyces trachealis]
MSPFLCQVKTASGATAVQIVSKSGGVRRIVKHLGSAHDEAQLEALLEVDRQKIAAWQDQGLVDLEYLDALPTRTGAATTTVESKHSRLLWQVLHRAYTRLGLRETVGGDRAFEQMVLARVIEPSSKAQVPRVLGNLGLEPVTVRTLFRCLGRCVWRGYRESLSEALFEHVTASRGLARCLYDVTTLYFEADKAGRAAAGRLLQGQADRPPGHRRPAGRPSWFPPPGRVLGGQPGRDHHDHPRHRGLPSRPGNRGARHRR